MVVRAPLDVLCGSLGVPIPWVRIIVLSVVASQTIRASLGDTWESSAGSWESLQNVLGVLRIPWGLLRTSLDVLARCALMIGKKHLHIFAHKGSAVI